jgi:hypothetical protein
VHSEAGSAVKLRLLAIGALPVLMLQECAPQCAPEPLTHVTVIWTVDWDKVAWCESGGQWGHGPVRNSHGTFSGGLMIGHQWWRHYGGQEFAPTPSSATKEQQILVAERIVEANGGGYSGADKGWQCVR